MATKCLGGIWCEMLIQFETMEELIHLLKLI